MQQNLLLSVLIVLSTPLGLLLGWGLYACTVELKPQVTVTACIEQTLDGKIHVVDCDAGAGR